MSAGHHSMMSGKQLPYKRQVEFVDTNGGGVTMSDISEAPTFGYKTEGRIAVVVPSSDFMFGFMRTTSDHDRQGCRTFATNYTGYNSLWQDIARLRMRTDLFANAYALDEFFDFAILSNSTAATSFIKVDGVDKRQTYEPRSSTPLAIAFGICKEANTSTIYGRIKIAHLTLKQGDEVIAEFIPVETFEGDAGLYNAINGNIYTSSAGNPFALP